VLTKRQFEAYRLIAEGYNNSEIARRLGVAVRTVEFLTTEIYQRFGLSVTHPTLHPRGMLIVSYWRDMIRG